MADYELSTAIDRDKAVALAQESIAIWDKVKYSDEIATYILSRVASGETLAAACREVGTTAATFDYWIRRRPGLGEAYRHARRLGADAIADDIIDIVDTVPADALQIAKARLRTEMRLKLLAKWQPALYGDRVGIEHSGPEGQPIQVAYADVSQLARQMRSVLAGKQPPEALLEQGGLPEASAASGEEGEDVL